MQNVFRRSFLGLTTGIIASLSVVAAGLVVIPRTVYAEYLRTFFAPSRRWFAFLVAPVFALR